MGRMQVIVGLLPVVALAAACGQPAPPAPAAAPAAQAAPTQTPAERGKYLVSAVGGCDDCHTPKNFGPEGAMPDMSRRLSGHPSKDRLPPTPPGIIAPDKFGFLGSGDLTAWVGPWGTSYTANLTPDQATGLGSWNEGMFMKALRSGKHQGEGRPILPPMPWQAFTQMTDDDLKAIWAFLQTLPPIANAVPDPVPPPGAPPAAPAK